MKSARSFDLHGHHADKPANRSHRQASTLLSQSGRPNCMRPRGAQRTFLGPIKGGICVIVSRSGQNSGP